MDLTYRVHTVPILCWSPVQLLDRPVQPTSQCLNVKPHG